MSKLKSMATFVTSIDGVSFRMRRRSTMVMAEAKGLLAVAGQIAGANATVKEEDIDESKVASFYEAILKVALLEVNEGDGWVPASECDPDGLRACSDILLAKFMESGLQVDPTPPSCGA